MTLTITPARLSGAVTVPPSKSQAHRLLIAAALAQGESRVSNLARSQDIDATRRCLTALGAALTPTPEGLSIQGATPRRDGELPRLDCGESGSTLRFLIPVALALRGGGVFTGRGRLMDRPQAPYERLFRDKGVSWEKLGGALTVQGRLTPGEYPLPGDVSSQFFTGLLFALPLLDGDSDIRPTTAVESRDYIGMTLDVLSGAGVVVEESRDCLHIRGGQRYAPADRAVEGDWSQAGFWYAAASLGNPVEVTGLDANSTQGDKVIARHQVALGRSGDVELDVSGCPDLVPPLAVMAALRDGVTRLTNAARLRLKESDRLRAVTAVLTALGADVAEGPDRLTIRGRETLAGGVMVDAFHDHRIAMMAAIAATRCAAPIVLTGAESVAKSYPDFWRHYELLGGKLTWNM